MRKTTLLPTAILLLLAACGGPPSSDGDSRSGAGSASADTPAASGASLDDALDDLGPETKLGALGSAVETVLDGVDGYEIDGSTITFDLGTQQHDELSSDCLIIGTAAGALDPPEDARIVLAYANADVECDL